jgi:hypothetical protein
MVCVQVRTHPWKEGKEKDNGQGQLSLQVEANLQGLHFVAFR